MSEQIFELTVKVEPKSSEPVAKHKLTEGKFVRNVKLVKSEDKREIICIAMVANEIDAHGDLFTPEAVEFAANSFVSQYNVSKDIGIDHANEFPDIDLIGSWYTEKGGNFDGLEAPPFSWVMKNKINDDAVWDQIKSGEKTGLSIQGPAWGYSPAEIAKSVDSAEENSEQTPKRIFTKADPDNVDLVDSGANKKTLIWKRREPMATKIEPLAPDAIVTTSVAKNTPAEKPVTEPAITPETPETPKEPVAEVAKAKSFTPNRETQLKNGISALMQLAQDLGVNTDPEPEPAPETVSKSVGSEIAAALVKGLAPILDNTNTTIKALAERLEKVETARGPSNVGEGEQPAPQTLEKNAKSPFNGVFDELPIAGS